MGILLQDLGPIFLDSGGTIFSLYNFWNYYGANKAEKYISMMKKLLKDRTGRSDITFRQVYEEYGKELCIIASDITSMSTAFFHPKTTPNRPIWEAARMSMSIPVLMTPFIDTKSGNYFVDGGLVRNYPLDIFDGWYLSMKPKDSFVLKLSEIDETKTIREWQFDTDGLNEVDPSKTVGLLLFSGYENDFRKKQLIELSGKNLVKRPTGTTLSKKRGAELDKYLEEVERDSKVIAAVKQFLKLVLSLKMTDDNYSDEITREEMEKIFVNENFDKNEQAKLVFGKGGITADEAMGIMTGNNDAKVVTEDQFFNFYLDQGINLQAVIDGSSGRNDIQSIADFGSALLSTIDLSEKMDQLKVRDVA